MSSLYYNRPFAMRVHENQKYLKHGDNVGIDLVWNDLPLYQWVFRKEGVPSYDGQQSVKTGDIVALYNLRRDDYLVYGKQDMGVSLCWLKDQSAIPVNDPYNWVISGENILKSFRLRNGSNGKYLTLLSPIPWQRAINLGWEDKAVEPFVARSSNATITVKSIACQMTQAFDLIKAYKNDPYIRDLRDKVRIKFNGDEVWHDKKIEFFVGRTYHPWIKLRAEIGTTVELKVNGSDPNYPMITFDPEDNLKKRGIYVVPGEFIESYSRDSSFYSVFVTIEADDDLPRLEIAKPQLGQPNICKLEDLFPSFTITLSTSSIIAKGETEKAFAQRSEEFLLEDAETGSTIRCFASIVDESEIETNRKRYSELRNRLNKREEPEIFPQTDDELRAGCGISTDFKVQLFPEILESKLREQFDWPRLFNIRFGNSVAYHAVYVSDELPDAESFRFFHVTDAHIGVRRDIIADDIENHSLLTEDQKQIIRDAYRNANDEFRSIIHHANKSDVDFIVMTGDMVDAFTDEWQRWPAGNRSNFHHLSRIITGKDGRSERLKRPIFMIPGNHEYYTFSPPLDLYISVPCKTAPHRDDALQATGLNAVATYDQFGNLEDEIKNSSIKMKGVPNTTLQSNQDEITERQDEITKRFRQNRLKLVDIMALCRPNSMYDYKYASMQGAAPSLVPSYLQLSYYLNEIAYDTSYSVKLGKHQLAFLNTGQDIQLSRVLKREGDPREAGFSSETIQILEKAIAQTTEGRVFVFTHAPVVNIEVINQMTESEHLKNPSPPNAVTIHLTKTLGIGEADLLENGFPQHNTRHFKEGAWRYLEEACVVAGRDKFLSVITLNAPKIAAVFSGHTHGVREFRVDPQLPGKDGFRYYTENYSGSDAKLTDLPKGFTTNQLPHYSRQGYWNAKDWLERHAPLLLSSGTLRPKMKEGDDQEKKPAALFREVWVQKDAIMSMKMQTSKKWKPLEFKKPRIVTKPNFVRFKCCIPGNQDRCSLRIINENFSSSVLDISQIEIVGDSDFKLEGPSTNLQLGTPVDLQLFFSPQSTGYESGLRQADLVIHSNDPLHPQSSVPLRGWVLVPDAYDTSPDSNDTIELATELVVDNTNRSTKFDSLTLHEKDKDFFKISFPVVDPEKEKGLMEQGDHEFKHVVISSRDARLRICAEERYHLGNSFTFIMFAKDEHDQWKQVKRENHVYETEIRVPNQVFPGAQAYLQITSADDELIPYSLEITYAPASYSGRATRALVEKRWFKTPWDGVLFENPYDLVAAIINILDRSIAKIDLVRDEIGQVADFRRHVGHLAQATHIYDRAEQLYRDSAQSYGSLGEYRLAVAVLGELETMHREMGNVAKAQQVHVQLTRVYTQGERFYSQNARSYERNEKFHLAVAMLGDLEALHQKNGNITKARAVRSELRRVYDKGKEVCLNSAQSFERLGNFNLAVNALGDLEAMHIAAGNIAEAQQVREHILRLQP
ncbi:MAG: metallophosphoesterase [Anaerolinea sp.]|nr:metallophosphoesterase [Anaerolinea sp.]